MRRMVLGVVRTLAVTGGVSLAVIGGAAPANEGKGTSPTSAGDLAQQLQPTMKEFEDAWNRHDTKAMAATFSEDAVLINPSGRIARGRGEIEKLFEDEHVRGALKSTEFSHRLTDLRQVAPGLVFLDEEITITGARDPGGQALPDQHVHGSMLVAKQGGRWQIVEGRPYVAVPPGPRGVASSAPRTADTPSPAAQQEQSGTGSSGSTAREPGR